MNTLFKLNKALRANATASPDDVLATKTFLQGQGFYEAPKWGLTDFPDQALFSAIKAFQKSNDLRVDGVMKLGGETETLMKTQAQNLQSFGRYGNTLLAHITPAEARMLKEQGGAGTVNPDTGLLEFYKADKEGKAEGQYIWRTAGDGKVRSSHAERDGKTFSWDNPPDGGHPGVARNCRCEAEPVKAKNTDCKELKRLMDEAWDRHDALQKPVEDAKQDVDVTEQILSDLKTNKMNIERDLITAGFQNRPKTGGVFDIVVITLEVRELLRKLEEIKQQIEIEERTLKQRKEKLEQLKHDQKNEREYAEELSR